MEDKPFMMTNAQLYVKWVKENGLDQEFIESLNEIKKNGNDMPCLLTTRDREHIFKELEKQATLGDFELYHFTEMRRSSFNVESEEWEGRVGHSEDLPTLLGYANDIKGARIVVFEDAVWALRQQSRLGQIGSLKEAVGELMKTLDQALSTVRFDDNYFLIFIESPYAVKGVEKEIAGRFLLQNVRLVDMPDEKGLFRRGKLHCILPFLRAYCKTAAPEPPSWQSDSWQKLRRDGSGKRKERTVPLEVKEIGDVNEAAREALHKEGNRDAGEADIEVQKETDLENTGTRAEGEEDDFTRFFSADQALDWTIHELGPESTGLEKSAAIHRALTAWLVPIDEPLHERGQLLDGRVEAVRIFPGKPLRWTRNARLLPDTMRRNVVGLDPVHTPESERAGLTRYLCEGWHIADDGRLENAAKVKAIWGLSTSQIPHQIHDAPRRLMLGGSLQMRALDLQAPPELPEDVVDSRKWNPPGANLQVAFSAFGGWTHEDAIVLSKTGSEKLRKWYKKEVQILIPALATRVEIPVTQFVARENEVVARGTRLVRAFMDLYALGLRLYEAESLTAKDGWLEVALSESFLPVDAKILDVRRESIIDLAKNNQTTAFYSKIQRLSGDDSGFLRWREVITFDIEVSSSASVGDKLSTRHGIKGVVSKIVDDELLLVDGGKAEIVLSPIGIARRGAMGQFREAVSPASPKLPQKSGRIFVMRQPQDAEPRCRVRGFGTDDEHLKRYGRNERGQRYGWMEFSALMAHGVPEIARELLSPSRSTSGWMLWEAKTWLRKQQRVAMTEEGSQLNLTDPAVDGEILRNVTSRVLVRQALNRYLSLLGAEVKKGHLVQAKSINAFTIPCKTYGQYKEALDLLNNAEQFAENGGIGVIELETNVYAYTLYNYKLTKKSINMLQSRKLPKRILEKIRNSGGIVNREYNDGESLLNTIEEISYRRLTEKNRELILKHSREKRKILSDRIYVLPPWLRPDSGGVTHKLTQAYQKLMERIAFKQGGIGGAARKCFDIAMASGRKYKNEEGGALPGFLRREVLGRRLTRSARAVIIPRPDLKIDQIAIPKRVWDVLFEGLPEENTKLVLVNRNPTLHRLGLLALRPVLDKSDAPVFGLPLGVLKGLGADFDGDQASVVALETSEALKAAEKLWPGTEGLQVDPFRKGVPAFQLLNELSNPEKEWELADKGKPQVEWCKAHFNLLQLQKKKIGIGWKGEGKTNEFDLWTGLNVDQVKDCLGLWQGLEEIDWKDRADMEMEKIYAVRQKGRLGGIARRELYRLAYLNDEQFWRSVAALQAVTERLVQQTLSVKTGEAGEEKQRFEVGDFFKNPNSDKSKESLRLLEPNNPTLDPNKIAESLGNRKRPAGLLAWLATPTLKTLLTVITSSRKDYRSVDPRVSWFL
jgi:hypothetical protein